MQNKYLKNAVSFIETILFFVVFAPGQSELKLANGQYVLIERELIFVQIALWKILLMM